mgnify:CR=1 FL=1
MASNEELRAMGIINNNSNNNSNKSNTRTNNVASVIKGLAIVVVIIGVLGGFVAIDKTDFAIPLIVASIISAVFVYALGEIIQLLEDIKNK